MKSFKRIITMLLAIAMILTNVGLVAFAGYSFSDIDDANVDAAVSKLVAYGIITGYDDNGDGIAEVFKPNNQITRAEFAAIVTRMKGLDDSLPTEAVTGFGDLDNDPDRAWARPYVKAAVGAGIVNGFPDGTFRAADPVTYEQAVKMLICAAGYEPVARSEYNKTIAINPKATWSAGYISAANKHGVTKNAFTTQITEPALRGTVAVLTSNAVDLAPLVFDEDGYLTKDESGGTQNEVNGVTISGYITETYITGIDTDDTGLDLDEIRIDATDNKRDGKYTVSRELRDSIDFNDYIGRQVTAYYDSVEREITTIKIIDRDSLLINESDIMNITSTQIKYRVDGGTNTESLLDTTFIVNGKYVRNYDLESNFKNGTIEIFHSRGNKIALVKNYDVFVVNSLDRTNEKIFLKYETYKGNNYFQFPTTDSTKIKIYVKSDGSSSYKLTSYDSLRLSEYDVINYMESPSYSAGTPVRVMYVTRGKETGKVTTSFGDGRRVVLDDETYYLTQQYHNFTGNDRDKKVTFELSTTYTYYLDYTGQIAAVNYNATASDSTWLYGYVMEVDTSTNEVLLLQSSGSYDVFTLKDRVRVDGKLMEADAAFDVLYDAAREINNNADDSILNSEKAHSYCQPLQYSVEGNRMIDGLDTHLSGTGSVKPGNEFTYDGKFNGTASSTSTTKVVVGGNSYNVNSSTIVFYIPQDRTDRKSYAKISATTAFAVTKNRMVETFAVDSTKSGNPAKMVLVYGLNPSFSFIGNSPYMLVTEIHGGSYNREYVGYVNGAKDTKTVSVSTNFVSKIDGEENLVKESAVKKGDLIRYIVDGKGEIVAAKMLYDSSEGNTTTFEDGTNFVEAEEGSGNNFFAAMGTVQSKEDEDKRIRVMAGSERNYKYSDSTRIYKLDEEGNPYEITIEEVYDGTLGMASSTVIVISKTKTNDATAAVIYVIK